MIPAKHRFYSPQGECTPGGDNTWLVLDYETFRWYQVTGPAELLPDFDDGTHMLAKYVDELGPDIHSITLSADGNILSVSSEDPAWEIRYPEVPKSIETSELAMRSELRELDRLHICTDLIEYRPTKEIVAFKYAVIQGRIPSVWDDFHILRAIKGSKHFAEFHRVVIDDTSNKVLGFTSKYISGGTLEHYPRDRPVYFKWLKQLTTAVDTLNLHFGISHQDVAPRNILIDSNNLKVFDFDCAALIGTEKEREERNDIKGVVFTVYEALTKDEHFRDVPYDEQNEHDVEDLKEWNVAVPLDDGKDILAYRQYLADWAISRRTTRTIKHYSEASNPISFPAYTPPAVDLTIPGKKRKFLYRVMFHVP